MRAKDVADFVFSRLLVLISEKRIEPGSEQERLFLKTEIELGLHNLFKSHGVDLFPTITVGWEPTHPDDLTIQYCEQTQAVMRALQLL